MRILILTKNVSTENETQRMLQILGHEVFTTSKMLDLYLSTGDTMTATLLIYALLVKQFLIMRRTILLHNWQIGHVPFFAKLKGFLMKRSNIQRVL